MIFVFGSNQRGIHGAGAALEAKKSYGAKLGNGYGHFGQSFAIPTKDTNIQTLPLVNIQQYVSGFINYAKQHPELSFKVTQIGCGLAGYKPVDIAPMFLDSPNNCFFDIGWEQQFTALGVVKEYWNA